MRANYCNCNCILKLFSFILFYQMRDLDIGGIVRAQTGNNKVVIATRLSLTKSLHFMSFLQDRWMLQHLVSEGERKLLWKRDNNFRRGWAHGWVKPNSKLWTATFVSFSHLLVAGLICTREWWVKINSHLKNKSGKEVNLCEHFSDLKWTVEEIWNVHN